MAAAAVARFYDGHKVFTTLAGNNEADSVIGNLRLRSEDNNEEIWITDLSWNSPAAGAHLVELAERGASLTKHLLAFARRQPLQPREIDVGTLVLETVKLLRPTLGEQIQISQQLAEDAWPALVDPNQLTTAVLNLALNARDAMPFGGKLVVEVA